MWPPSPVRNLSMSGILVPEGAQAVDSACPWHHSPVVPMAKAMFLGWPTSLPTLDNEKVRWEYQIDPHLAGRHWKENLTRQNVPSISLFPHIWWRYTLPKKAISCLDRSSGSLGFSEAWPQPAHTACKHRDMWIKIFLLESPSHHTSKALHSVTSDPDFRVLENLEPLSLPNYRSELLQITEHHSHCGQTEAPHPTYLHRDSLGNVHNQFHIGIIVIVGPSWDRNILICHLDILWNQMRKGKKKWEAEVHCMTAYGHWKDNQEDSVATRYTCVWSFEDNWTWLPLCANLYATRTRPGREERKKEGNYQNSWDERWGCSIHPYFKFIYILFGH